MGDGARMKIILKGEPIPQKRHRTAVRENRAHIYDPQSGLKNMVSKKIKHLALLELYEEKNEINENALYLASNEVYYVAVSFYFSPPKSATRAKQTLSTWNLEHHNIKPDLDNLSKFYLDAGNGILWEDDRQIAKLSLEKKYANEPRVEIEVKKVNGCKISNTTKDVLQIISKKQFSEIVDEILLYAMEETREKYDQIAKILICLSKYHKEFSAINRKILKKTEEKNDN